MMGKSISYTTVNLHIAVKCVMPKRILLGQTNNLFILEH